jgi:hypothetical protein
MRTTSLLYSTMRLCLVILGLGLLFSSCKKDEANKGISENQMTLTVDGSTRTLIVGTIVKNINDSIGLKLYSTSGTNALSTVNINIACANLEKKTYQVLPNVTDFLNGGGVGVVIANYIDVTLTGTTTTYSNAKSGASGSVTITEVATTYIKGTYNMVLVSTSSDAKKTISGEFYSKITMQE